MDEEGLQTRHLGRVDPRRQGAPMAAVVLVKVASMASVFWAYTISTQLPLAIFLFCVKASSAVVYVLLQKPFSSGKRLSRTMWMRVIRYSILYLLTNLLWVSGLSLCGALRTSLLWGHSEAAVTSLLSVLACSQTQGKGRGGLFFLLGVVCLLLFDNDHSSVSVEHPEGPHNSMITHVFYRVFSFLGVPDHKGGIVILLVGIPLAAVQKKFGRKLSVEVGGYKRLEALSTITSSLLLLPWATTQLLTSSLPLPPTSIITCLAMLGLMQSADFYTISIFSQRLESTLVSRLSSSSSFISSLALAYLIWFYYPNTEHTPSVGVVIAAILFLLATVILTRSSPRSSSSSFIGYASSGLPLYSSSSSQHHPSLSSLLRQGMRKILEDSNSRRIFYFLLLNLTYTGVEMVYGVWTNSLGLISDGFHMLFDSSALFLGLCAALMVHWKPTRVFSFGYRRVEVLSGFVNSLFLVAIACVVLSEALERLIDPPDINTEKLLVVSIAGFIVNLVGIITFSRNHTHSHGSHGHSQSAHGHSHNANMEGVFLHVLADTMGSVGVIISSILVQTYGWLIVDPICSIFISILIIISVLPLLRESSEILLLATPNYCHFQETLDKLPLLDGIHSYSDAHLWQLGCSGLAGTVHLQVAPSANDQKIITMVTNFMRDNGVSNLTVQVEKEKFLLSSAPISYVRQTFPSTPPDVYVSHGPQTGEIKAV